MVSPRPPKVGGSNQPSTPATNAWPRTCSRCKGRAMRPCSGRRGCGGRSAMPTA